MPQRKQIGPRETREGSSKPKGIIRNGKQVKWVGGAQRKELVNGAGAKANKAPKVKDMVIRLGKPKICSKRPWECKNGRVKDAQRNEASQGRLKNDIGQGSPRWYKN